LEPPWTGWAAVDYRPAKLGNETNTSMIPYPNKLRSKREIKLKKEAVLERPTRGGSPTGPLGALQS